MVSDIEPFSSTNSDLRSTGITGLDFQLGGGIPKGKSVIVYGDALSGIDLIAEQFWKADKSGESSYLMSDANLKTGMIDMRRFGMHDILTSMKGEWIVVDSLSSLIDRFGIAAGIALLSGGTMDILGRGANIMYILYKDMHKPSDLTYIERYCDIFISLDTVMHGNDIERNLSVCKLAGANLPVRVYPYNILAQGIELSTTGRVV